MSNGLGNAVNDNRKRVTLEAIAQNPWNAVDRDVPDDADRSLLERTAFAAAECAKAACAAARAAEITEPELGGRYWSRYADAAERSNEVRHHLGELALIAKVSLFLDPAKLQEKALRSIMVEVADARPPRAPITAGDIDRNPWSIVRGSFSGVEPELLERVCDIAVRLIGEALQRSGSGAHGREEAALWKDYAQAAGNTYVDAYRALGANARGVLGTQDEPEALTRQAIAHNPRTAIELEIPTDPSRELLSVIAATAKDLARRYEAEGKLSISQNDAGEFFALSAEARQRQQDAEARLGALGDGTQPEEPLRAPAAAAPVLETDRDEAALIDMLGDTALRAIHEPVPHGADAKLLEELSGNLDGALDRLDALIRSSGAAGISPPYLALQFGKAGARQEEVEAHLAEMDGPAPGAMIGPAGGTAERAPREEKFEAPPAGDSGLEAGLQTVREAARDWAADGIAYVKLCGKAYQQHFDGWRFWQWPTYPQSLTLPQPRNEAERAGLESYLGAFEADLGYRPQIDFEARQAPEAAEAIAAPGEPTVRTDGHERAAKVRIEASAHDKSFLGFVACCIREGLARGAGMVFDKVAGLFNAAPAMAARESDERPGARDQAALFDDGERAVVAGGPDAEGVVRLQAGEPERDAYLAMIMAPRAAAQADRLDRNQQDPEVGQRRGPRL